MAFQDYRREWRPTANTLIVPGTTDMSKARSPLLKLTHFAEPVQVRTSYQRMSQTVTNHWIRSEFSSNASKHTSGDDLRQSQAYKRNTDHGKRDSIKFGPGNEDASQDTPREAQQLVQEYDGFRTRGIAGYTGKQPLPSQRRPRQVEEIVDPSKFFGKGGSCERKPWTKGIPGYTGHQPNIEHHNPGSESERYGIFMNMPSSGIMTADVGTRLNDTYISARTGDDMSTSSPVSGNSQSSQRKLKGMAMTNTIADIARRKIEEALAFSDEMVPHEGSACTLNLAKRYHIAPDRSSDGHQPRPPVDKPKPGPVSEGKDAWKATKTWRPKHEVSCEFDWFMERPAPVDKRPSVECKGEHWKNMSMLVVHDGEHAGQPKLRYSDVKHMMKNKQSFGGVQNTVQTQIGQHAIAP